MKKTLEEYIREDKNFRELLLKLDGGIMKFWAEHPDRDFDANLFDDYEKQIVKAYLQANKRNRTLVSMPENEKKLNARNWYHLTEKEIHYQVVLQPILATLPKEISELVNHYVNDYLEDTYRDYRQCFYPDGITPSALYDEVVKQFSLGGLARNCMDYILREHHHPEVWSKKKSEYALMNEFFIRQYSEVIPEDAYKMLRQAVKEKLVGKSPDECRLEAIKTMKLVKDFSRMIYSSGEVSISDCTGRYIVDKEFLRNLAGGDTALLILSNAKVPPLHECFFNYVSLLNDIGRIWAARLLKDYNIDMHELEKETGAILYPVTEPLQNPDGALHDNYKYYVDKDYSDSLDDQCCIYDEKQAKDLFDALHNKGLKTIKIEETNNKDICHSVLNYISANDMRYYYEGWRNGKHGAICQWDGIYRFVEQARGKSGMVDDVKRNRDENPIVAIGIVAYWLQFNSRMDTVIKRLTKYNCEIPKDIREQFDKYTKIRFEQFREEHRDDPNTWDWDWEREFYTNVIIPHEIAFNKQSEALFDYISDSDIVLVRSVMYSYIKYLKKTRTDKGYRVSPELLVLRAVDSQDDTKYEDLEDYEVNTILDKLEGEGFIRVAWTEGHIPEGTMMLDKGRVYLKQLEEGGGVVETKHSVREITWEDEKQCFKAAVLHVMEMKKHTGEYLFEKPTQWKAVYRFAVDNGIMYDVEDPKEPKEKSTPQYALFEAFAKELQLDVNPPTRLPFTKSSINDINKEYYIRYNTSYPWSHDGITDARSIKLYTELDDVYLALKEDYDKLLGQAERSL